MHHPDNPASGRVLAKAGFTRIGTDALESVPDMKLNDLGPLMARPNEEQLARARAGGGMMTVGAHTVGGPDQVAIASR